jgi:DNA mismatch repair ATPase MutS
LGIDAKAMQDGRFAYSYRLKPGVNRDSHGLKVAQLAGMPSSAITIAKEAQGVLRSKIEGGFISSSQMRLLGQSLSKAPGKVRDL